MSFVNTMQLENALIGMQHVCQGPLHTDSIGLARQSNCLQSLCLTALLQHANACGQIVVLLSNSLRCAAAAELNTAHEPA